MMIASVPSRAEVHELHRRKFREWSQTETAGVVGPEFVNAREAVGIDRPVTFAFRGHPFVLHPIPWEDGVDLHEIQMRVLRPESPADYRAACSEAVALMGRLARRRGWRGRLRRLLPNPFRHASEREIGEVLDFFWKCRTGTPFPVWLDHVIELARRGRRTGSPGSTNSARHTTGGRARGGTTSTA